MEILIIAGAGLSGGALIGAIGVGGVIVVPTLVGLAGLPLREAVQITFFGFAAAGLVALVSSPRRDLPSIYPLLLAAVPGAVAGTVVVHLVPPLLIAWLVAAVAFGSLVAGAIPRTAGAGRGLGLASGAGLGLVTGFGSSISGTGGPLILTPLLLMMGIEVRQTIRAGQVIQLPVSLAATITHLTYAPLEWGRASVLAGTLVVGMLAGRTLLNRVPPTLLSRVATLAVVLTTCAMLVSAYGSHS